MAALTPDELLRLQVLFRATLSAHSIAHSIALDQNVVIYLENLATPVYFCIYRGRASLDASLRRFFVYDYPAGTRNAVWPILLLAALLLKCSVVGHVLALGNLDWFYTFISKSLVGS